MSTVESVVATFATCARTRLRAGEEPTISSNIDERSISSRSARFSVAQPLLGPLAIVDVRSTGVPAKDPSFLVAQGMVPDQEPAVLAIVAPQAPLEFEWHRAGQPLRCAHPSVGPSRRGGRDTGLPLWVGGHQLFPGESRVIE